MNHLQLPLKRSRAVSEGQRIEYRAVLLALFVAAICAGFFTCGGVAFADGAGTDKGQTHQSMRVTYDIRGTAPTHDGQRLRVSVDLGNVVIKSQDSGKIDYTVHLEADGSARDAKQLLKTFIVTSRTDADGVVVRGLTTNKQDAGRLWITVQINVPMNYNLDVSTGGGNIQIDDVNGRAFLTTAGGNISSGNVNGPARFVTKGGHITARNIGGDWAATTGGGHITAGTIGGIATLHTDGGHIQVGGIGGPGHLTTGGGNVYVGHSASQLVAETIGGQIEVGEAAGLVNAKTNGGGIHVVHMIGPSNLQTGGGSIYLTQVDGTVKASTGTGAITAWFVAPPKAESTCEFQSGEGDIVVYIPRQLPVTIDAQIQSDDKHQFFVDPAFRLLITRDPGPNGSEMLHAVGSLNGGGEVVHLRTVSGNIRLIASDAAKQVEIYKHQMKQMQDNMQNMTRQYEGRAEESKITTP
jgi:DUF4097 and DUF4098 domain-containing protein YvlB